MDFKELYENLHGAADPINITEKFLGAIHML